MATGKTHDRTSRLVGLVLPVAAWPVFQTFGFLPALSVGAGLFLGGAVVGVWLTPDLDQADTEWGSKAFHRWKRIGLAGLWRSYGKLPHHHWVSHTPLVSTLFRWVEVWPITLPWVIAANYFSPLLWFVLGLFLGNAVADAAHTILDWACMLDNKHRKFKLVGWPDQRLRRAVSVALFAGVAVGAWSFF